MVGTNFCSPPPHAGGRKTRKPFGVTVFQMASLQPYLDMVAKPRKEKHRRKKNIVTRGFSHSVMFLVRFIYRVVDIMFQDTVAIASLFF